MTHGKPMRTEFSPFHNDADWIRASRATPRWLSAYLVVTWSAALAGLGYMGWQLAMTLQHSLLTVLH